MSKTTTLALLAAAFALAPPVAVHAQAASGGFQGGGFTGGGFPNQGGGLQGGSGFSGGGYPGSLSRGVTAKPDWMSKRVSLNVKNVNAQKAIREVIDKVGIKTYTLEVNYIIYSFKDGQLPPGTDTSVLDRPYANPVTLNIPSATAEEALRRISDAAGVSVNFRTEDNQLTVNVQKTATGYGTIYNIGPKSTIDPAIADALAQAAKTAKDVQTFYTAPTMVTLQASSTLPDTRVGLDVRDGDARDTLKTVLKQANLAYALEDDLPATSEKHSFTFENVPIATALDVICQSIGIGWRLEMPGGKPLVRVGKKYAAKPAFPSEAQVRQLFVTPSVPATPKPARQP